MPNRLAAATSPYLRQHADNPVDWWPWCPEAFAEARRRDVSVLLSVGYAACHWCHVMAHESFADAEIAAYMNRHFVSIKVDREERPDVDAVYMAALQSMTGRGGWPMTCFLTPDGQPFHCAMYFPPSQFQRLLRAVAGAWRRERWSLVDQGHRLTARLSQETARPDSAQAHSARPDSARGDSARADSGWALDAQGLDAAVASLRGEFDTSRGGFGGAPKFPPSMLLEFLLRHHARAGEGLDMVEQTCAAMARGGIYDQLAGGFARYSVDAAWTVPHFEKMLYDNALLLRVYLHWWRATGSPLARRVTVEVADWMIGELRTPEGGFASSVDADSDGEEGAYYLWTPAELRSALGRDDDAWAAHVFGVTESGTAGHGRSVPRLASEPDDPARLARVRERLAEARSARTRPDRDDKVVAAWNGLAIAALAEAGALLGRPDLTGAAESAAQLLADVHLHDDRLFRTSRQGTAGTSTSTDASTDASAGVLEDYGDVAEGFLALYSVTGAADWIRRAGVLLDVVLARFTDGQGGFYDTRDDAEQLYCRPRQRTETATPCGQSAAAGALLWYASLTGSARHREAAESALSQMGAEARQRPRYAGWTLATAEAMAAGPVQIAVIGPRADRRTLGLQRAALLAPAAVVAIGDPADPAAVPLLRDRLMIDGKPTAYVCRDFACQLPTTDQRELCEQLAVDHAVTEGQAGDRAHC